ncbi:hypothetical protein ABK836_16375 [Enterobacter hormaechei]|uniref:hypothetical protein n=1 Tax=Enterobacter hormaechei TaxID=158836 RepID=UPI000791F138|nr:hypothetical protein [Enterobacter hormaechei]QLU71423.1 hypothetical protein HV217_08715 [Enterobacter cloacae]QLU91550.1 hypothetical protein HV266_08300 [Enterobacter roggenkampii]DAF10912.1 MAG TPA: heat shock protein [Caudoviricetes sp.]HED3660526.1 hypothetical protein [Enterobacter hormaechei subsp. hoffmannii]QLN58186.1 hypothetical protein HV067_08075 [Enterobacter hormaechei]
MSNNDRKIKTLTLSQIIDKVNNKNLAHYIFDFKSNNKISSSSETTFIAWIMSYFKPLRFNVVSGSIVDIQGVHGGYSVNFQLQKKVYNYNSKKSLSLDLVIELYDQDSKMTISKIGIEYDGDREHINSHGILDDKRKDLIVLKQTGMMRLRIQPEMLQKDEDIKNVYRSIKKYFEQYTKLLPKKKIPASYVDCPLCEGVQIMGAEACPVCIGNGSVKKNFYRVIDIDVFDSFDCPDCLRKSVKNCRKCRGTGFLNRDEAIKIRRDELKNT